MNRAKRSVTQTGAHTTNEENQMTHVLTQTAAPKFGRRQSIFKTVVTWLLDLDQAYQLSNSRLLSSRETLTRITLRKSLINGLRREKIHHL